MNSDVYQMALDILVFVSIAVFAPTGEYEQGGSSNRGLACGVTSCSVAPPFTWTRQRVGISPPQPFMKPTAKKDGTNIRVGDLLTVEGGLGKSFMQGAVNVGIAYYAQWKLTDDDFGVDLAPVLGRELGRRR